MAARPWITPQDVRDYTDHADVINRTDAKLSIDISRAESKIMSITHNKFDDPDTYPKIPESVRLAVILVAEAYAKNALERAKKQIKSETFDDYSYTLGSGEIDLESLDLDELLKDFVIAENAGDVVLRLRKL
jgi:hypothetical protein